MNPLTFTENIQPILNLFLSLAEHFGLISAVAFILLSTRTLRRMISHELTLMDKLALILFFGIFGIFGTYDGDQGGNNDRSSLNSDRSSEPP